MKNMSKKTLVIMAMLPLVAMAQTSFDDEVNAELDRLYSQKSAQSANVNVLQGQSAQSASAQQVPTQMVSAPQVQNQVAAPQVQNQIVQQQVITAQQHQEVVQKQPTTVIEAAPLLESKADLIRKARQDAELTTEQKIVEKLEQSRMEDEKRRADILFGEKFNSINTTQTATVAPAPVVVTEQVAAPAPVIQESEEKIDKDTVRSEISAAISDLKKQEEKPKSKSYFSVLAGTGDYPDAVNVKGQYALGFSVGKQMNDRMLVEGTFLYSNYQVEQREAFYYNYDLYHRITEMDQYSVGMAAKYQLLDGAVHPVVGALMAYTYRSFTDSQFAIYADSSTSHALDLGLLTGLDVDMSETFTIGIDLRYMMNLSNKSDSGFQKSFVQPVLKSEQPIEKLNYYTFSIVGKSTF